MMKNFLRIALVIFALIGSTVSFGFWSFQEFDSTFDHAFENLSASYIAISPIVRERPTTATTTSVTATSTSLEQATSTVATSTSSGQATSTATTSDASLTTSSSQDDIDPDFKLAFPLNKSSVYIGCTYEISWSASTTITSLKTALIDAGTKEVSGPITSGLAKEYKIKPDSQSFDWKVGTVWPGTYYIKVSKVNDVETSFISKYFKISKMPVGINREDKINICRGSHGSYL